jgi:hypothetical protein
MISDFADVELRLACEESSSEETLYLNSDILKKSISIFDILIEFAKTKSMRDRDFKLVNLSFKKGIECASFVHILRYLYGFPLPDKLNLLSILLCAEQVTTRCRMKVLTNSRFL